MSAHTGAVAEVADATARTAPWIFRTLRIDDAALPIRWPNPRQNVSRAVAPVQNKLLPMEGFGRALRRRASEIGLSDAEVARRAGLDEGRYGNYVRDSREPDLATLVKISRVLATTPNALLGLTDDPVKDHARALAALAALDEDGRRLAIAVLKTMVRHQPQRDT